MIFGRQFPDRNYLKLKDKKMIQNEQIYLSGQKDIQDLPKSQRMKNSKRYLSVEQDYKSIVWKTNIVEVKGNNNEIIMINIRKTKTKSHLSLAKFYCPLQKYIYVCRKINKQLQKKFFMKLKKMYSYKTLNEDTKKIEDLICFSIQDQGLDLIISRRQFNKMYQAIKIYQNVRLIQHMLGLTKDMEIK